MFISFWSFFQGLCSLSKRVRCKKDKKISVIFWYGAMFIKGLCFLLLPDVPGAMLIPGTTSIPDSTVKSDLLKKIQK